MKNVYVLIAGSGQARTAEVQPGSTAGDILRGLGLPDYLLSKTPSGEFFANTESIYEKVSDGQKVFASTKADVGGRLLDRLIEPIFQRFPIFSATRPTIPLRTTRTGDPVRVAPVPRPYWQDAGWVRNGNFYRGCYQTAFGAYEGSIEQRSPSEFAFSILRPPQEVLGSSHGRCFNPRRRGWFEIHMSRRARDISSGIIAVERLIAECFRNGGQ